MKFSKKYNNEMKYIGEDEKLKRDRDKRVREGRMEQIDTIG